MQFLGKKTKIKFRVYFALNCRPLRYSSELLFWFKMFRGVCLFAEKSLKPFLLLYSFVLSFSLFQLNFHSTL